MGSHKREEGLTRITLRIAPTSLELVTQVRRFQDTVIQEQIEFDGLDDALVHVEVCGLIILQTFYIQHVTLSTSISCYISVAQYSPHTV